MNPKYQFFCENCSFKRFSNGRDFDDLVEVKSSKLFVKSPYIDPETKKVVVPDFIITKKKFKCPKCGMIIKARAIKNTEKEKDV